MTTSTPANASSPASIRPVGPPPAITTACSVIAAPFRMNANFELARRRSAAAQTRSARSGVTPTQPVVESDATTQDREADRGAIDRIAGNAVSTFDVGLAGDGEEYAPGDCAHESPLDPARHPAARLERKLISVR